ncbi:AAA family ATPase [Streptomyces sp. NPDC005799]|uniref:AAA family ATPase n=1 Tax=Streptomyces sp. NPDC005799 TaxID=3154678 RepID=UPI003402AB84
MYSLSLTCLDHLVLGFCGLCCSPTHRRQLVSIVASSDAHAPYPQLLGRSPELEVLSKSLRGSARACWTLLLGGPGVGKSALLDAARVQASRDGVTVLHTVRREISKDDRYSAVRDLFRSFGLNGLDAAPPQLLDERASGALASLTTHVGLHQGTHSGEQSPKSPAELDDYQVLDRLSRAVTQLTSRTPMAVLLDDAHWCDTASLDWLSFLARRMGARPLHVVVAVSDQYMAVSPALVALLQVPGIRVIRLRPLDMEDVAHAIEHALGQHADESFIRGCAEATGGNPLLLNRLLDALATEGVRPTRDDVRLAVTIGREICASTALHYLDRDRSRSHVRAVLRAMAVLDLYPTPYSESWAPIGESSELVGKLAGVSAPLVAEVVDQLQQDALVRLCTLPSIGQAVLRSQPGDSLMRLREQAARLLLDSGQPVETVARQLLLVDRPSELWMTTALHEAAKEAAERDEPETAAGYLRHMLEAGITTTQRNQAHLALADVLAASDPEDAMSHLCEVMAHADEIRTRALAAARYGLTAIEVRQTTAALPFLVETLETVKAFLGPEAPAADQELVLLLEWVLLAMGADHSQTHLRTLTMTTAPGWPYRQLAGHTAIERRMLAAHAFLTALGGHSAAEVLEIVHRSIRVRDTDTPLLTVTHSVLALLMADDLDTALNLLRTPVAVGPTEGGLRALVHYAAGSISTAAEEAQAALNRGSRGGEDAFPSIVLSLVLAERNALQEAEAVLDRAGAVDDSVIQSSLLLLARARVKGGQGDLHGAYRLALLCRQQMEKAGAMDPVLVPWRPYAVSLLVRIGRQREADKLAQEGLTQARRRNTPRALGTALTSCAAVADGDRRIQLLRSALQSFAASPARLQHARTAYVLGTALLREGDLQEARSLLGTASSLARSCGAMPLSRQADHALATAGAQPQHAHGAGTLTKSELRVSALAAQGATNREIAETLFISRRTVESHLTSAYRKLGTSGRAVLPAALESLWSEGT